jgi:hypothetical protein
VWRTVLLGSREACLLGGALTLRGRRHYMALPEGAEHLVPDFMRTYRTQPLSGTPDDVEVEQLVGHPARATEL